MTAVILAGGKGTRLHPYTFTIPKPLLPVGDVPIIEVLLHQLRNSGFRRVILTLGHMAPIFTASLGSGTRFGLSLEYAYEDEPLGTAGPLREIQGLADDFLVMNGDILTTLSFAELMDAHLRAGAAATIAVSHREVQIDYGVVVPTEAGELGDYVEKPTIPYEVSMGVNVLNRRAIRLIPERQRFDIPELMVALKNAGERVLCHRTECYWQDIGRFDDYQQASLDFTSDPTRFVGPLP